MADMQELIARLEAAEVGSRELDARLWDLEDDRPRHDLDGDGAIYKRDPEDTVAFDSPPAFTTSLDAALALAERVLPGRVWCLLLGGPQEDSATADGEPEPISGNARTLPLAVCIAILKSIPHGDEAAGEVSPNLKAKAQGDGG